MAALPDLEEGKSTTRAPRFNRDYIDDGKQECMILPWLKIHKLWDVIEDGSFIPKRVVKIGDVTS